MVGPHPAGDVPRAEVHAYIRLYVHLNTRAPRSIQEWSPFWVIRTSIYLEESVILCILADPRESQRHFSDYVHRHGLRFNDQCPTFLDYGLDISWDISSNFFGVNRSSQGIWLSPDNRILSRSSTAGRTTWFEFAGRHLLWQTCGVRLDDPHRRVEHRTRSIWLSESKSLEARARRKRRQLLTVEGRAGILKENSKSVADR